MTSLETLFTSDFLSARVYFLITIPPKFQARTFQPGESDDDDEDDDDEYTDDDEEEVQSPIDDVDPFIFFMETMHGTPLYPLFSSLDLCSPTSLSLFPLYIHSLTTSLNHNSLTFLCPTR